MRHTIAMVPLIQNARPTGVGSNRKITAKTMPPTLPLAPTIPLCGGKSVGLTLAISDRPIVP